MTNDVLQLVGRSQPLLAKDIERLDHQLIAEVSKSSFLVLGGAGSIGQAVVKEIFKREPRKLHVVDISENNLVELVRDVRSSMGYISGEFKTFALDIGSWEYDAFIKSDGQYDYVLNLSALKHVRSEKDPYTLMRMIEVNILNTIKTIDQSSKNGTQKYFCVSTDKAANPVNMMGASKRIMEMFLMEKSTQVKISTARFANVAFSDGSLLHGFNKRLEKRQPIVAPSDVKRYFVTPEESGELCLLSCIFGDNRDIFFPKLDEELHLISFADIAIKFLKARSFKPVVCESEQEARDLMMTAPEEGQWPCLFAPSDTTGEKSFEEFFTESEFVDNTTFEKLGVVKNGLAQAHDGLSGFLEKLESLKARQYWDKSDLLSMFFELIPSFGHEEKGKYLDSKM